ncbi:MAG: CoA transferase, partial [Deltaproteobacteria bacterium]|nr:CoA transferase [Deltaproteobacteria bacterium]
KKVRPTREGSQPKAVGPLGIYRYRDNQYITILTTPHQWPQVLRAMNRPDLASDPRFAKPRARAINHLELTKIIEEWLATFPTRDDALAALDQERVPCAPVLTVNEAMAHPHLNQRKTVRWVDDPLLGRVAIPGIPVKFSAWPDRMALRAARLGEDNERVLRAYLGLKDGQIRELYHSGVLVRDATLGPNPVGE